MKFHNLLLLINSKSGKGDFMFNLRLLMTLFLSKRFFISTLLGFLLLSESVFAVPTIYYFPANFDGNTQRPQEVSTQGAFPLICDGGTNGPRLAGLDLTRLYAGAASCPSNGSERFAQEVEYIFLVDDTSALSPYLINQFQSQNLLETGRGDRQIVRPTVLQFEPRAERAGFKILVVGEMAYRLGSFTSQTWFAQLTTRFSSVVAGTSSDDDIAFMYHGSYMNSSLVEIINPTTEKLMAFSQKQLGSGSAASAVSSSGPPTNNYIRQCQDNEVPIPPVWSPTSREWRNQGRITPFIASDLSLVEVWTYTSTSPQGVCYALPRMRTAYTDIQALGIICQSETTGKACFWDNKRRPASSTPRRPSAGTASSNPGNFFLGADTFNVNVADMRDGYNLDENCTDCHRGQNVFLIHSGDALQVRGLDTIPAIRYQPLSGIPTDPSWNNPPSNLQTQLSALGLDQCTLCHNNTDANEIAEPRVGRGENLYCSTILERFIALNMPPGAAGSWTSGYREEVMKIQEVCCNTYNTNIFRYPNSHPDRSLRGRLRPCPETTP
jgi:hypothetical protein